MDLNKTYKKIILFFITIIVSFICLEIFSRIFFYVSNKDIKAFKKFPGRYTESYFSGYRLSPNWFLDNDQKKEKINSYGFRSPEFEFLKNKKTYRIICLGSSVVYGKGNNEETFPFYLEQKLNELKINNINVEVINAGVPGYTSYHTMTQFLTSLIDLKPDLIISYQLFTEMWYAWDINFDKMQSENFKPINTNISYERILDKSYFLIIVNSTLRKYENKVIDNSNISDSDFSKNEIRNFDESYLYYFSRNIKHMALVCDYQNIDLILSVPLSLFKEKNTEAEKKIIYDYENKEFYLDFIKKGNKILKSISNKHKNVHFFNPSNHIKSDITILEDRYHPTLKGNKLLSEEFKNYIIKLDLLKID